MGIKEFREAVHTGPMVVWSLNHRCNFQCRYCFSPISLLQNEHPLCGKYSVQYIRDCFDKTGQHWWIYLTGGEPFLYPDFANLCFNLTQEHFITINTNLSTSNCLDFAERIDPDKVYSINASLHIEERESRNLLKRYIRYVKYFQEKGFQIRAGYVVYPSLFSRLTNDIKMLKEEGIAIVNLKTFRGYYKARYYPKAYTQQERNIIAGYAIDKKEIDIIDIIGKSLSFFGKSCKAGYNFFVMDPAGNIRRCSSSTKSYGNFFEGNFLPDKKVKPCPFPKCCCPYEGMRRTSDKRCNYFSIFKSILDESPSYIKLKARPSKIIRLLMKRFGLVNQ